MDVLHVERLGGADIDAFALADRTALVTVVFAQNLTAGIYKLSWLKTFCAESLFEK